jgi:hypothetical protein
MRYAPGVGGNEFARRDMQGNPFTQEPIQWMPEGDPKQRCIALINAAFPGRVKRRATLRATKRRKSSMLRVQNDNTQNRNYFVTASKPEYQFD